MIAGRLWSAIQVTTASGIAAVVDLVLEHPGRYTGFVAQEQFRLTEILANRFGRYCAPGGPKQASGGVVGSGKARLLRQQVGDGSARTPLRFSLSSPPPATAPAPRPGRAARP